MKINYTLLIIFGVIVLAIVYIISQRQRAELQARMMENQVNMIDAQIRQQEACKSNWLCASSQILGGVSDVTSGLFPEGGISSWFNKD